MKSLSRIILVLLPAVLLGFPAAADTGGVPDAKKAGWYTNIVDVDFVKEYAGVPRKKDVMIIDARPKARKYDKGHIPGAYSIPLRAFDKQSSTLPADKSTLLVYYCGGTKCMLSHKSAFKAEVLGYTNVRVYARGFPDWKKNGNLVAVALPHLKKLLDTSAPMVVVDSRPKKRKYDKGHIPGAISIPDREFEKMSSLLPADKATPLYFYCGGYKCKLSPNSAAKAMKLGYTSVSLVPEGYPGWKKMVAAAAAAPPKIIAGKDEGTITVESFKKIMASAPDSIALVDVRDQEEFAEGTIPGAVNMPIDGFEKQMDRLPGNKNIVFLCGTGGRAGEAYDIIKMLKPGIKAHFLNAEIDFNKDGSYVMKEITE
jgi:rhodanese-related sulfurtransferase